MKTKAVIIPKNKAEWIILLIRWALCAASLARAFAAVANLKQGKYGEGFVDAGFGLVFLMNASTDLGNLWASRSMKPMAAVKANPTSARFMGGMLLVYILVIGGIALQCV
jgi:hypothetical protein